MVRSLLSIAKTAFTAHTGSLVSPTKKVTSHNSGILARNAISSARPFLFSNTLWSSSSSVDSMSPCSLIIYNISTSFKLILTHLAALLQIPSLNGLMYLNKINSYLNLDGLDVLNRLTTINCVVSSNIVLTYFFLFNSDQIQKNNMAQVATTVETITITRPLKLLLRVKAMKCPFWIRIDTLKYSIKI
ncbi:hypothetical protein AGLY_008363 [Aphis glycines]|uniref:Uncharacterized protein n=1 Tax=Aphis glycines TaxID=307491 RepID=A0A6G0TM30_APHGL|nr:hypothetical protein AGLY_008363 [Aphis glycines]